MDLDWDKVEILKTPENQFDWLKLIFSMKESIRDHFCKVSSDFKSFWQVTIFHPTYLPKYQIMDWDWDKVEILKTLKNELDWLKIIFFMKESVRDHFCKVSSDFKPFWQVTIFHPTYLPRYQIMDWDWDKVEILETPKSELDWLKLIFFMKESIRYHFCKVSSDFKPFWQVTIFHPTYLPRF